MTRGGGGFGGWGEDGMWRLRRRGIPDHEGYIHAYFGLDHRVGHFRPLSITS